jgi:alanine racemase
MKQIPNGRPTFCIVDLDALRWNFGEARKKVAPGVKILSVVKANAYGHGAREVAKLLAQEGSDAFGVATVEEGMELRRAGITFPIVVLPGVYPEQLEEILENRLTPTVCEPVMLRALENESRKRGVSLSFHLKVDTGMGRVGFPASDIDSWLPELKKLKALNLEGLFSHFSQAENVEGSYTLKQLQTFRDVVERVRRAGHCPSQIHLANSASVITLPDAHFSLVRPGLMLYGVYPGAKMAGQISLKPALSWKTRILQLKKLPKGSSVSYGQTFVTKRESLIATLPVGYADGYPRLLSNRGAVLIGGKRAPIVGRVCMDLTMVDVTDIEKTKQGDEVVLLGKQESDAISADEMAGWAETIPYEIFTSISARVPRIYSNS